MPYMQLDLEEASREGAGEQRAGLRKAGLREAALTLLQIQTSWGRAG